MREDRRRIPAFAECFIRLGLHPLFRLYWKPKLLNGGRFADFKKPCFVYGNHSHNLDPFILNMFTPWMDATAGVLTQEYFRGKFMNARLRGIDLYPTRKHVPEPHLIRNIYKEINNKRSFLIYPEGGRRWAGQPIPWIESTAKIFAKSGLPIYPVVTYGSYVGWPRWATYPRPANIKIKICDPLQFDRNTPLDEVSARLKAPIDFDETIVDEDIKPGWAYRPATGIHRLLYRDPVSGKNGGIFTPDGTYVRNIAGTMNYKMLPDSTLLDEKSGEIITTATLYNQIKVLPIEADKAGVIIQNRVDLHEEDTFPNLINRGKVEATLYADAIRITSPTYSPTLSLDQILYTGVERSSKLQLFLQDKMIQLTFNGDGSALQWQDMLLRLKSTQKSEAAPVVESSK